MSSKLEFMKDKIDKEKAKIAKISPQYTIDEASDSEDSFEEGLD